MWGSTAHAGGRGGKGGGGGWGNEFGRNNESDRSRDNGTSVKSTPQAQPPAASSSSRNSGSGNNNSSNASSSRDNSGSISSSGSSSGRDSGGGRDSASSGTTVNQSAAGNRDTQDKNGSDKGEDKSGPPKTNSRAEAATPREEVKPPPATVAEVFERWFKSTETNGTTNPSPAKGSSSIDTSSGPRATSVPSQTSPTAPPKPTIAAADKAANGTPPANAAPKSAVAKALASARPHGAPTLPPIGNSSIIPNEVLAQKLKPDAIERAQKRGFTVEPTAPLAQLGTSVTRLVAPKDMDTAQARAWLQADTPGVLFDFNRVYRLYRPANKDSLREAGRTSPARLGGPDTCDGDRCAGKQMIQWKNELQSCSRGLRVGIIDTDVDQQHPAFPVGKLRVGSFIPEGRAKAPNWHGTGVLALLAGASNSGTPGLIPDGDFYAAGVFFTDENGDFATDTVSVLKALDWMSVFDVKLVNMSFAGPKDDLIQKAITRLSAKGVVFVAAAGNEGPTAPPSYPAAYKQVLAVTAVNKDLRNYSYATRGSHIDVAAPGVDIWTAIPDAREGYRSGTSFAAPYVTAIVATILNGSPRRQKEDLLGTLKIVDLGPSGRDPIYGHGLLVAPTDCQSGFSTEMALARPGVTPAPVSATATSWSTGVASGTTATPSMPSLAVGFTKP